MNLLYFLFSWFVLELYFGTGFAKSKLGFLPGGPQEPKFQYFFGQFFLKIWRILNEFEQTFTKFTKMKKKTKKIGREMCLPVEGKILEISFRNCNPCFGVP